MKHKILMLIAFATLGLTFATLAQVPAYVPTNGLVGYWPFNGNANDESGNGNDGTVNGATLTNDRNGNANQAYNFSANSNMIGIPNTSINPQNFTISLWCKILSPWSYTTFNMLKVGPNNPTSYGGFSLRYDQNDLAYGTGNYCVYGSISDASNFLHTHSNFYGYASVANWNHFVLIKNVDTTKLYINNQLETIDINGPLLIDFANAYLQIGNQQNLNSITCGIRNIDDIGIWNRALTQQEITGLYTSTSTSNCTFSSNHFTQDTISACGSSYTLSAGAGYSNYNWNTGATTSSITVTNSGWYKCTVSNSSGCTASDSIYVSLLNANILQNDTTVCAGNTVQLAVSNTSTSTNNLICWQSLNAPNAAYTRIVKSSNGTYFVASATLSTSQLFSTNNINTWTTGVSPFSSHLNLLFHKSNSGKIFAGTNHQGVYVSVNNGSNWSYAFGSGYGCGALDMQETNQGTLLISIGGYLRGIYKSTDDGVTWSPKLSGLDFTDLEWLTGTNTTFAQNNNGQLWRSTNMGDTWTALSTAPFYGLAGKVKCIGSEVWVFAIDGKVYKSNDQGQNWILVSTMSFTANSSVYCNDFVIDNMGVWWVGMNNQGIWRSVNNGISWVKSDNCFNGEFRYFYLEGNVLYATSSLGINKINTQIYGQSTCLWSTGDTTSTINVSPTQTTTYYCTVNNGISSCTDSVTVTVNPLPTNIFALDTIAACGSSYTLSAGAGYSNYNWSTGDTISSISVSNSGWYQCSVSNSAGCTTSDSVYVSLVNASILQNDSTICLGTSIQLNAVGNCIGSNTGIPQWQLLIPGSSYISGEINFNPNGFNQSTQTWYSVFKNGSINRVYAFNLANNTVTSLPSNNAPSELYSYAYDKTYNRLLASRVGRDIVYSLPLTGGSWQQIASGSYDSESYSSNAFWNPITNRFSYFGGYGWYSTKNWIWENNGSGWINSYANNNNCNLARRVGNGIAPNSTGTKQYIFSGQGSCNGDQFASSCSLGSPWPTDIGVYCWLRDIWELDLTTYQFTNILSVNNQSITREGSFSFDHSNNAFYLIGGRAPTSTYTVYTPYTMDVSRFRNGLDAGFTNILVGGIAPPADRDGTSIYDANGNRIIYARTDGIWALNLGSSCSLSYLWSTGDTTATINVSPTQTTTYYCTVSNGITSCTDSVTVTVNPLPTNLFTQDTIAACGSSYTLSAGAGYSNYNWSTGTTTSSISVTNSGWYKCTVSNSAGCTASDSVYVSLVNANILQNDTTICAGSLLNLTLQQNISNSSTCIGNLISPNPWPYPGAYNAGFIDLGNFGIQNTFSISLWVNPSIQQNGISILMDCSHGGSSNWVIQSFGNSNLYTWGNMNINLTPNVWQHLLLTYNNGQRTCYINGNLSSTIYDPINYSGNPNVYLGNWPEGGRRFSGLVDELFITKLALTPADVFPIININPLNNSTIGLWKFNEGNGSLSINNSNNQYVNIGSWYWSNNAPSFNQSTCLWSTGDTTATINVNPTQTTTYYCTVSNGTSSCTDSVTVTVNPLPTNIFALDTIAACGSSYTLSAGAGYSNYNWSTGATTSSIVVNNSGWYQCTVTNSAGCTISDSIYLAINALPTVTANATATTVCAGTSVTLTGGGASTYTWSGGVTNGVSFVPTATTIYTVTGTDVNGCTNTATQTITVNALPIVIANASATTVCTGNSVTLTGGGANTYTWSGGVTNGISFVPTATTTYTVTGTNAAGCTNTATKTITVNALPTVTANASATTVCAGTSVTLTGGGGANTYTWTGGITNGVSFVPTATTTYTVTGTDVNGCTNTATQTITVNALPTVTANATATTVCAGTSVTLIGGGANTYAWSGGITNGVSFVPTATTTYTVTGIDVNGCTNTATQTITVNALPTVTANASATTVCAGTSVTLTGGGASTYTWTGGITNGVSFVPTATTTYTVTGTDVNGCTNTATINIGLQTASSISVLNTTNASCNAGCDGTATMSNVPNMTYSINPSVIPPIVGNIITGLCAGTTYTITGTSSVTGCTSTTSVTIGTVSGPVAPTILSSTPASCNPGCNGIVILYSPVTMVYSVSPSGPLVTGNKISALCAGTVYTVTGTDVNGCTVTTTISVGTYPNPPAPTSVVTSNATCVPGCDGVVTMSPPIDLTYTVSPGGTAIANVIEGLCDGVIYTVTGTDIMGCTATTTISVGSQTASPISVLNTTNASCNAGCDGTATMSNVLNMTYSINPSVIPPIVGNAITGLCAGTTYTITGTSSVTGCTSTTTLTVSSNPLPTVTANASATTVCAGNTVTLTGGGANTYTWTGGITNGISFVPTSTTTYTVTGTDVNGCTNTATKTITVNALPILVISASKQLYCEKDTVGILTGNPIGGVWSGVGVLGNTFNPTVAGLGSFYVVYTYTATNGCTNKDSLLMKVTSCLGVDDVSDENLFSVYPNPTTSEINVKTDVQLIGSDFVLYDNAGNVLRRGKIKSANTLIKLSDYSAGVYYFTVVNPLYGKHSIKVIKK